MEHGIFFITLGPGCGILGDFEANVIVDIHFCEGSKKIE